ncbi:MAG: hypothetical protein ACK4IX_04100, partial [Candidatus Sericytochromatia bacterium]
MNSSNKFLGLTLALLIGVGGIYGCQSPANSTKPSNSNVSSSKPTTTTPTTQVATSNSSQVKEALIMESEDEKYFDDSDTSLSSTDKSFATKALGDRLLGKLDPAAGEDRMVALNGGAKETKKANLKAKLKQFVSKNGAVKRNEDGSLTIDTNKLKENLKKAKELAKEQVQKLKRKNNVVRTGDVEEVKNEDGSTTKTGTVAFENKKNGLKRNIVAVRNLNADGKLDSANYELTSEHKNFTRTVKRTVTVNDDGSKTIVFYSLTTFKDGRKREVNRTVNLDKDGNGTATGTIKMTKKDGTEKTITINATISKTAGTITVAKDPATGLEVKSEEKADGTTTVTTTEEGKTSTEVVTEEKAEEVEASEPAPATEASPAPAESPA